MRDPELTPSARLLTELRASDASFFEYTLEQARRQREHFMALPPGGERAQHFADTAARSLAETRALEDAGEESFDEYRRRYFEPA